MTSRCFVLCCLLAGLQVGHALVNSVAELYNALEASTNKKVGFVAETNYLSVKKVLPSDVVPVYPYSDATSLQNDVANGVLFAGFISGDVPTGHFNYFSSRVISGQGMFTLGTPMLLQVLNAAIAQVQRAGTPQTLIRNYSGKLFTEVDTCGTSATAFPWPSVTALDTAAETWWTNGCLSGGSGCAIRIGTIYAKFDWFYDYTVSPPTGFYPDLYSAISTVIATQYASRGCKGFTRVIDSAKTTSSSLLLLLAAQSSPGAATFDATDMFFYYTSTFTGTVTATATGGTYSGVARTAVFDATCVVLGGDGSFFTKVELNQDSPVLSSGAIAGIVIGGVAGLAACVFAAVMILRERAGRPLFMKLVDQDEGEGITTVEVEIGEENGPRPDVDGAGVAMHGIAQAGRAAIGGTSLQHA